MGQTHSHSFPSRDEVLQNFQAHTKMSEDFDSRTMPGMTKVLFSMTQPSGTNANASPRLTDIDDCAKVCVEQLTIGRTHGKCVLVGRVLKSGIYTGGRTLCWKT